MEYQGSKEETFLESRFTLRGQKKVDGRWKLFCLVHNIEKLAHHEYAQ